MAEDDEFNSSIVPVYGSPPPPPSDQPDWSAANVLVTMELRLLNEKAALMSTLALDPYLKNAVGTHPDTFTKAVVEIEAAVRAVELAMRSINDATERVRELYKVVARSKSRLPDFDSGTGGV